MRGGKRQYFPRHPDKLLPTVKRDILSVTYNTCVHQIQMSPSLPFTNVTGGVNLLLEGAGLSLFQ
jgi:hypothetical protein